MGRRRRRNEGLIELALSSDWKVSAVLAGICLIGAYVFVPAMLGRSPFTVGLIGVFQPIGLLLAALFALIACGKVAASALRSPSRASFTTGSAANLPTGRSPRERVEPVMSPPIASQRAAQDPMDLPLREPGQPAPKPDSWSLDVLQAMEWKRFEDVCTSFYREKGIRAETTPLGPDGGVDIRLYQDTNQPDRCTAIVQCKAWGEKQVGVKLVRELRGVMAHEKIEKAFFMAPGSYSEEAKNFAKENRITLITGELFLAMLRRLPADANRRLLAFATEGDWTTPSCPRCGTKMVAREGTKGRFWGCASYPKCRQTLGAKSGI